MGTITLSKDQMKELVASDKILLEKQAEKDIVAIKKKLEKDIKKLESKYKDNKFTIPETVKKKRKARTKRVNVDDKKIIELLSKKYAVNKIAVELKSSSNTINKHLKALAQEKTFDKNLLSHLKARKTKDNEDFWTSK